MRSQHGSINQVGGLNDRGIEPLSVVAFHRKRNRVGFELGLCSSIASDMVYEPNTRKLMVNFVVEIAGDPSTRIEDSDRWFRHPAWTGQLPDQREQHMRRRVQAFDRAMIRCVVQVGLDGDLLSSLVSGV